jgi:RNA polymerase sigma-70 factor (ECF subfamily)
MGVIDVLEGQQRQSMDERVGTAPPAERVGIDRAAAFHRLADLHLDRCYRLAAVVLGNGSEAQDAVHDAFVTAWRRYDSLRDPACLEAWFDRIVVNTCRDRMRHGRRQQARDFSDRGDVAQADATAGLADADVVRCALSRLDPDDQIVLALRYYRDLKVADVAQAMAIHPRAATSRLHRALARLRRSLADVAETTP